MDNIHIVKESTQPVEKKPLVLVLQYLGSISSLCPEKTVCVL